MADEKAIAMPTAAEGTGTGDGDRAAKAAGLINAVRANPSLADLQALLSDPEIAALATSDTGIAVLTGMINGDITAKQAEAILTSGKGGADMAAEYTKVVQKDKIVASEVGGKVESIGAATTVTASTPTMDASVVTGGGVVTADVAAAKVDASSTTSVATGDILPSTLQPKEMPKGGVFVTPRSSGSMSKT